jgi:hypothetical protein
MAGSKRMFDHTTFAELQWKRDPFSPSHYTLSPGFQIRSVLFPVEFIEIMEDIHALKCMRDSPAFVCEDTTWIMHVDNHQASIQSRLVDLPNQSLFLECCYLAAYIAAVQLCKKVWRASSMPVSRIHGPGSESVFTSPLSYSVIQEEYANLYGIVACVIAINRQAAASRPRWVMG